MKRRARMGGNATAKASVALKSGDGMIWKCHCRALNHYSSEWRKDCGLTDPTPKFTEGVIGLQIHTGGGVKMRWKNIYVKEH